MDLLADLHHLTPRDQVIAALDGELPPTPRAWRQRAEAIAASTHLAHTVGANQVFVDLLAHAREHHDARLARWWGPAQTAAATGQRLHPDGHAVWTESGPEGERQVGFWLEYDTGTEPLHRLVGKIGPYRHFRRDTGTDYPVLLVLSNLVREANLHRLMDVDRAQRSATVATTTPQAVAAHGDGLAGRVWQIAGAPDTRHGLIDLPHGPSRSGPYDPGPPTAEQDPLHLLRLFRW